MKTVCLSALLVLTVVCGCQKSTLPDKNPSPAAEAAAGQEYEIVLERSPHYKIGSKYEMSCEGTLA